MRGRPCQSHLPPRIPLRSARATSLTFLLALFHLSSAAAAEADCRELDRNYTITNADITSIQRNAVLFASAAKDCGALARRLIADGASLQARDRAGAMPLALAARGGHAALVERFLAEGAAIDARDLAGATALYAAVESERPSTVAALLNRGADPNLTGRSDVSPLAAAAFRGNDRIVELLLSRGADADHLDATGKTPIVYASARGFVLVVRRLLDANVDAKARYGNDLTALMWAAGHDDGVGPGAALGVAELLIEHGAVVDAADNRGRTALMIAAERGDAAVTARLVAHDATLALRDKAGRTACDLAANDAVREALAGRCDASTGRRDTTPSP
jgi:ankyrin repeat protein